MTLRDGCAVAVVPGTRLSAIAFHGSADVRMRRPRVPDRQHHIDELGTSTFWNYLTLSDSLLTVSEVA